MTRHRVYINRPLDFGVQGDGHQVAHFRHLSGGFKVNVWLAILD